MSDIATIPTSPRLNKVNLEFIRKKRNLPSHDQYSEKIKAEKKETDESELISETKSNLERLDSLIKIEIRELTKELNTLMYPNISKDTGVTGEKVYASSEFNNAMILHDKRPSNIEAILKTAWENKRTEFVFWTIDLYLNDSETSYTDKTKMRNLLERLNEELGIVDKQESKKALEVELLEVEAYLEMIETDPALYEAKISKAIHISKVMYENGQLEAKSVLID